VLKSTDTPVGSGVGSVGVGAGVSGTSGIVGSTGSFLQELRTMAKTIEKNKNRAVNFFIIYTYWQM
jgi:hypothetical protein